MNNKNICLVLLFASASLLCAQNGLIGEYYNGRDFGQLKMTRTDKALDFYWDRSAPAPGIASDDFSVRWKGRIKAPKTGKYRFKAKVDDGLRVRVGGALVINAWDMNDHVDYTGYIDLRAGEFYTLEVEYFNGLLEGELRLFWQLPGEEPVFGGMFGNNDKKIGSEHFFLPPDPEKSTAKPAPASVSKSTSVAAPKSAPVRKPTPASKPAPVRKPKPAPATKPSSGPVHRDTLDLYIPKVVNFDKTKDVILSESFASLDQLAAFLRRNPALKVSVEGHTDNVGDPAKNLELSEGRARNVGKYLSEHGVDAGRISTKGYGDTRPLSKEKIKGGYAPNRRVEFVLSK
jgi:outer membrane protein OmpA-like peptidoglycan-associated protein